MPLIREQLLSEMLPFENEWKFNCLTSKKRTNCKIHPECKVQFNHCSRLLKFLFSSDMQKLKINLKKISLNNLDDSFRVLIRIIKTSEYSRLLELHLPGGSVQIDEYLKNVEDLCGYLAEKCQKLNKLHLPVASNACLDSLSTLPELQYLKIDRTKHLNYQGLMHLCHDKSCTKYYLKILHIGKLRFV